MFQTSVKVNWNLMKWSTWLQAFQKKEKTILNLF